MLFRALLLAFEVLLLLAAEVLRDPPLLVELPALREAEPPLRATAVLVLLLAEARPLFILLPPRLEPVLLLVALLLAALLPVLFEELLVAVPLDEELPPLLNEPVPDADLNRLDAVFFDAPALREEPPRDDFVAALLPLLREEVLREEPPRAEDFFGELLREELLRLPSVRLDAPFEAPPRLDALRLLPLLFDPLLLAELLREEPDLDEEELPLVDLDDPFDEPPRPEDDPPLELEAPRLEDLLDALFLEAPLDEDLPPELLLADFFAAAFLVDFAM